LSSVPHPAHNPLSTSDAPAKAPNIIVIICDDLGYGDLGCYGSQMQTPNLDKMAAEGMRFTHFNAGHPLCSASRAALLTGRYAGRSGTKNAIMPYDTDGMSLDETTLADLFRGKGYRSMCVGKWHLGNSQEYLPTNRGFDRFYGVPYSNDMRPLPLIRDTEVLEEDTDRDLLTQRYTAEATQFLREPAETPFFLYLAYSYPHDPARSSPDFSGRSPHGDFGDAVAEIDWSVGEVMTALREAGKQSDTIVLFTSDHGPWFQGSPGLLRGRKGSTFEGGFRVPLIAWGPEYVPAGTVQEGWASNLDLLPTLAALCGLQQPPQPLDGVNVGDLLNGKATTIDRPALLYFSPLLNDQALHCARTGPFKLRIAQTDGQSYINDQSGSRNYLLPRPELYNLETDPAESYDIARQYPEVVENIMNDIEHLIATFPPAIVEAYEKLKQNHANTVTPPAAAPRPGTGAPDWLWVPPDRR